VIGFIIGFVGAVMGIGGGFLLVLMLIYLLRVPTATVIGTPALTLVMASATVRITNHLVDALLASSDGGCDLARSTSAGRRSYQRRMASAPAWSPGARCRHPLRPQPRAHT
jgi:hypothetical protein